MVSKSSVSSNARSKKTTPRLQPKPEDFACYQALADDLGLTSVLELFRVFYHRYGQHLQDTWVIRGEHLPSAEVMRAELMQSGPIQAPSASAGDNGNKPLPKLEF